MARVQWGAVVALWLLTAGHVVRVRARRRTDRRLITALQTLRRWEAAPQGAPRIPLQRASDEQHLPPAEAVGAASGAGSPRAR